MKQNFRVRGLSLEQRVWRFMRKAGRPVKIAEIEVAFEICKANASSVMQRLARKGSAKRTGRTLATVYTATDLRPDDMRGLSVGSIQALREKSIARTRRDKRRPKIVVSSVACLHMPLVKQLRAAQRAAAEAK